MTRAGWKLVRVGHSGLAMFRASEGAAASRVRLVIVVDTGPLVVAVDGQHGACAELVRTRYRELVVLATLWSG